MLGAVNDSSKRVQTDGLPRISVSDEELSPQTVEDGTCQSQETRRDQLRNASQRVVVRVRHDCY